MIDTKTVALLAGTMLIAASANAQRTRIRIDDGWRFRMDAAERIGDLRRYSWTTRPASGVTLDLRALPKDLNDGEWAPTNLGTDVFGGHQGYAWYRTELGSGAASNDRAIHFEGVDDDCTVFLNGVRVGRHDGWNDPFDVPVGQAWKPSGPNSLVVLVRNTDGGGGIWGEVAVTKNAASIQPAEVRETFDDRTWRTVHLPHDYVVEGTFTPSADTSHGSLPVHPAWYRRTFTMPAGNRGKSVWIDFDGVYRNATVWLNGRKLGRQPSGYIGFRFDVAPYLRYGGRNVLAVHVDPRMSEGWWYEGGGIYRHVWMTVANPVHVEPWGTFVRSDVKTKSGKAGGPATVTIETKLDNQTPGMVHPTLAIDIVSPSGAKVAGARFQPALSADGATSALARVTVRNPQLWSVETPNLYRAVTTVSVGGRTIDRTVTPFGIRTIRFDADRGFFLNDLPVKLKGTCNHQDHAGVGIAMPDSLLEWRIRKLKEMGSNAYRCSHNAVASELLDVCDRLGMLVMDENRHLGDTSSPKTGRGTGATQLGELQSMVVRDRNHPSIIMWSMCNEEPLQGTEEGKRLMTVMKARVRALDPTRPVTSAMNGDWGRGFTLVQDLQGGNYNPGGYDWFHKNFPKMPLYGSETASTVGTRGIYANDPEKGYVSAYDVNHPGWGQTAEEGWKPIAERPFVAGGFVWTGFDYKGEPTPYGWPCVNSHFGILDICGFPKDNFYYYKAWWGDKPVVHIVPHWNWAGKEGTPIDVRVFSNAERVELLLGAESLGSRAVPKYGHVEWQVPYKPGTLVAVGYQGDKEIARDTVETTGPVRGLRMRTSQPTVIADGEELSVIKVDAVDEAGRVVPTADNLVRFSIDGGGAIAGVGNGDPSSHEPDKASQRHLFNGHCMVLVRGLKAGPIRLRAQSEGLQDGRIAVTAVR